MAGRYTALPSDNDDDRELEAAFDDSDDEATESQPLNPGPRTPAPVPGGYNFENLDYDYPPPGSPPPPTTTALPNNNWGNSNGHIPSFDTTAQRGPRRGWLERSARFLPTTVAQSLGISSSPPQGTIGGGTGNDGVFANVTAKPTAPTRVPGEDSLIVPEETRPEAPPSYAHAQADAVPPYWETTVHAPFAPDALGEMIIDALPTGSLFSFLWNMLVSISFQFIGFLLTYLLHTTHAARLGSRAGLGVTLIQYGFALKGKMDSPYSESGDNFWGWENPPPQPTPSGNDTTTQPPSYHMGINGTLTDEQAAMIVADATSDWLSFFLITIGWFVLVTSLVGFWRVKRWERGIVSSQNEASTAGPSASAGAPPPASQFERLFRVPPGAIFRQGFGLHRETHTPSRAEEGALSPTTSGETEFVIGADNPQRARLIREAVANEQRLHADLRAAGLL